MVDKGAGMKNLKKNLGLLAVGLGLVAGHCRGYANCSVNDQFFKIAVRCLWDGRRLAETGDACDQYRAKRLVACALRGMSIDQKGQGSEPGLGDSVDRVMGAFFNGQGEQIIRSYFGNNGKFQRAILEMPQSNVQALQVSHPTVNGQAFNEHVDEGTQTMSLVEGKIQTPSLIEDTKVKTEENWDVKITSPQELKALLASENHTTRGSLLVEGVNNIKREDLIFIAGRLDPKKVLFDRCSFIGDNCFYGVFGGSYGFEDFSIRNSHLSACQGVNIIGGLAGNASDILENLDLSNNDLGITKDESRTFLECFKGWFGDYFALSSIILSNNKFSKEEIDDFLSFMKDHFDEPDFVKF